MQGSYTGKYNFYLPYAGEQGWADKVNGNFSQIDTLLSDYKAAGFIKASHLDGSVSALLNGSLQSGSAAGGDFTGTFPNPALKNSGVQEGTYSFAQITVNSKGLITAVSAGDPNGTSPGDGTVGTAKLQDGAVTSSKIQNGAVTDDALGGRTAAPTAPTGFTTTLGGWLNWLTYSLAAITGRPFGQPPVTNLEELNAQVARKERSESVSGQWTFQQPLSVAAPTADGHAATLSYVRSAVAGINTSIQDGSLSSNKLGEEARPYSISTFYPGKPWTGALLLYWVADRGVVIRASNPGQAVCKQAGTADTAFAVTVGGQSVGTLNFAAGSRVGALRLSGDFTINTGQELCITTPSGADGAPSDVALTLRGAYLP